MAPSHSEVSNRPKNENDKLETGPTIAHGIGDQKLPSKVARADKTAPLPEQEHGAGIPGMNASGGTSQGLSQGPYAGQGKGPLKP
ncbi:hypothetical protein QBC40DRAFT_340946 [Triangularia verruculosa]|uniref:Uncharacterized protein n=1 Tax=Triangularia verruculosa TaxID=2587418 RepID=A0AAN7AVE5_9PEZI|nr:hypothetical protein QBC40DRAFT_340946 [Triangularia verruculosa]